MPIELIIATVAISLALLFTRGAYSASVATDRSA